MVQVDIWTILLLMSSFDAFVPTRQVPDLQKMIDELQVHLM